VEFLFVRSVRSTAQCEADSDCTDELEINIITQDADIWICAKHAARLCEQVAKRLAGS
jgi:hypothetical protein